MSEPTVSIRLADGTKTPEVPVSVLKEAVREIKRSQADAPGAGHNSADAHGVARDQLRAFIERIERLDEEIKCLNDDKRDVYGEAKGTGFDTKIMKKVIQIRRQDKDQRMEEEAILETYLAALGMIDGPPDEA